MSNRIAVVPGTFDPVTRGHMDILTRTSRIFNTVYVLVANNPDKTPLLPMHDRVDLVGQALEEYGFPRSEPKCNSESDRNGPIVKIHRFEKGLLVDCCKQLGATVIVRGLISADAHREASMAYANRNMSGIETVFILPDPPLSVVSSSMVRQLIALGGDISPYVPACVTRFFGTHSG